MTNVLQKSRQNNLFIGALRRSESLVFLNSANRRAKQLTHKVQVSFISKIKRPCQPHAQACITYHQTNNSKQLQVARRYRPQRPFSFCRPRQDRTMYTQCDAEKSHTHTHTHARAHTNTLPSVIIQTFKSACTSNNSSYSKNSNN